MRPFLENGNYVEIEPGVELYYEDTGNGNPILFIPGLTFSSELFCHQVEYFSKTHRVITLDPRSQGRSTKTTNGNHYAMHGKDLCFLIDALKLDQVTLVGWSTGNLTVWSYIHQFGTEKLKAAVTIDMSPKPMSNISADWTECSFEELAAVGTELFISQKGQRDFIYDYAKNIMVQRELSKAELEKIVSISCNTPFYLAHTLFVNAVICDMREGAKKAHDQIPTLMFIAEHWSDVASPYMNRNYPKTKTKVMGGHMMFWEHHALFNECLLHFIST